MSIVQTYVLTARPGQEAGVEACLQRLSAIVRSLDGCEAVAILAEANGAGRYVFMETYADAAAHQASAMRVPKDLLGELIDLLSDKPQVLTLRPVSTG